MSAFREAARVSGLLGKWAAPSMQAMCLVANTAITMLLPNKAGVPHGPPCFSEAEALVRTGWQCAQGLACASSCRTGKVPAELPKSTTCWRAVRCCCCCIWWLTHKSLPSTLFPQAAAGSEEGCGPVLSDCHPAAQAFPSAGLLFRCGGCECGWQPWQHLALKYACEN